MNRDQRRNHWDARYRDPDRRPQVPVVLSENAHLLPPSGRALDLACGLGGGALFLAKAGLAVSAWDVSPVAIERLRAEAKRRGLSIAAQVRDLETHPPEPRAFAVILVAHFLHRPLVPAIAEALEPGGLLFYQTFTRARVSDAGPSDPRYRLAPNELLHLFSGLRLRVYREEGLLGDRRRGFRDRALLVAQRLTES